MSNIFKSICSIWSNLNVLYSGQANQAQNLQIILVLPNKILMYFNAGKQSKQKILMHFSIGKQSQPKLKITPNKILFSYFQSKPKNSKYTCSIQSNLNVLWCRSAKWYYLFSQIKSLWILVRARKASQNSQIVIV